MPSYDAVIVTYNSSPVISETLQALQASTPPPRSIIVVDSASQDKTVALIRRQFPKVTLLPQKNNIGFGRGCNIGFQKAKSPYVLLVNPDLTVTKTAARRLIETIETDSRIAAVSPLIYGDKTKKTIYGFGATVTRYGFGYHPTSSKATINCFTGACALLRSDLAKQYGFCHHFFLYYEEAELAMRLLQDGHRFARVKDAVCYHEFGQSGPKEAAQAIGFRQFYGIQNRWYTLGELWPWSLLPAALVYNSFHLAFFLWFYIKHGQWTRLSIAWRAPGNLIKGLCHRRTIKPQNPQWYIQLPNISPKEMAAVQTIVLRNQA